MKKYSDYIDAGIRHFVYCMFAVILIFVLYALFNSDTKGEANIGDFSSYKWNDNWTIQSKKYSGKNVKIPMKISCDSRDEILLKNHLPQKLTNGMHVMVRTNLQDVEVFIDGELREVYKTDESNLMPYYLPSAYVLTELNESDAGKEIEIKLISKASGTINEVIIGNGNNAWFGVIKKNIFLSILAIFSIVISLIVIILYLALKGKIFINRSIFYLALLMNMIGIWIVSESKLRQLIFYHPSYSQYFAYYSVEMLGLLALLYFDNVQHKKYRKTYRVLELIMAIQFVVNSCLTFFGYELYQTLIFSHLELLGGVIVASVNIIKDIMTRVVKTYRVVAIGMAFFLLLTLGEITNFYSKNAIGFGAFACIGLLFLLFATIAQILLDSLGQIKQREKEQQESWINTIETIARTIDAKDEYTGGHSNRVSEYAGVLARGMAKQYNFIEEDILRIRYIGLMHDIGKIGVADTILNKSGRLTDEEFTLMKKHVEIGNALLKSMSNEMEDLLDGIRHHHERFDGKGYPDGLTGTDIPLIARILCIVDCYDAMTSNRVYRKRLSDEEVREELLKCAGTQFDPALISIFVDLLDKGDIAPITIDGMEIDEVGNVRKSSVLEHRLQEDLKCARVIIENPSHIRMASYIMKLAEYRNQKFECYIVGAKDSSKEEMEQLLKKYIHSTDINITYSDKNNLIVFFGRTKEEKDEIYKELEKMLDIEKL